MTWLIILVFLSFQVNEKLKKVDNDSCTVEICTCNPDLTFTCEKAKSEEAAKAFKCPIGCPPGCAMSIAAKDGKCECACVCAETTTAVPPYSTACPFPTTVFCRLDCQHRTLNSSDTVEHCKSKTEVKMARGCIGCPADTWSIKAAGVTYCVTKEVCCEVTVAGKKKLLKVILRTSIFYLSTIPFLAFRTHNGNTSKQ